MSIKYKKKSHDFYIVAQSVEKVFFPPGRATLLLTSTCFEGAPQAVAETAEKTYPPRTVRI